MLDRVRAFSTFVRQKLNPGLQRELYYIAPGSNWSLDWDAHYITKGVENQFGLRAHVATSAGKLAGEIVHYSSLWGGSASLGGNENRRNKTVATIFHGDKDDPAFADPLERMVDGQDSFFKIHTASRIMETRLLSWGIAKERLVLIPLGVDLDLFRPPSPDQKDLIRKEFGVPDGAICIGSFHKDGQGWDEGIEPKLIKGPDVFVDVIRMLAKNYPIFILLSAPARGFVKRGLDSLGVSYTHVVEKDYLRIPRMYKALDIYLIASREEGGPKGALESLASGIPLVSTRVGLVPDLVTNGKDGLLANIEDASELAKHISRFIEFPELRLKFAQYGLKTIQKYDWGKIAASYYNEIYALLLETK